MCNEGWGQNAHKNQTRIEEEKDKIWLTLNEEHKNMTGKTCSYDWTVACPSK